jgi:hypothetical protein
MGKTRRRVEVFMFHWEWSYDISILKREKYGMEINT